MTRNYKSTNWGLINIMLLPTTKAFMYITFIAYFPKLTPQMGVVWFVEC